MLAAYFENKLGFSFLAVFIIPLKIIVFLVLRYMYAIPEARIAPSVSIIRSPIVSDSPDFCMPYPKVWSIMNSKISHIVPIAIAKEKAKIASTHGFVWMSCLLAI